MKSMALVGILLVSIVAFTACETAPRTGMAIGAPAGALLGAGIGAAADDDHGEGALIGGLIGAAAGTATGYGVGKIVEHGNTYTYEIRNSNGSISRINVIRRGNSYVGPGGEYYPTLPSYNQIAQRYAQ